MARNRSLKGATPSWVESWSAVAIIGILFIVIGVVGVVAILKLSGASEAVAVITALTTAGGTIVGALAGANIGGSGRADALRKAEMVDKENDNLRTMASDYKSRADIAEAEAKRERKEAEFQRSAAVDGQMVLNQAFLLFNNLQDKIHNSQSGKSLQITPEELGDIDDGLTATSEALYAISRRRPPAAKSK